MRLSIQELPDIESPTEEQIANALVQLGKQHEGFAILSRSDLTYIQAACLKDGRFVVEYQEDSTNHHYYCHTDLTKEQVIKAFVSYPNQDGWWKKGIEWHRIRASAKAKHKLGSGIYFARLDAWSIPWLLCIITWGVGFFESKKAGANITFWLSMFFCSIALVFGSGTTRCLLEGRFGVKFGPPITRERSPVQFWLSVIFGYGTAAAIIALVVWKSWLAP